MHRLRSMAFSVIVFMFAMGASYAAANAATRQLTINPVQAVESPATLTTSVSIASPENANGMLLADFTNDVAAQHPLIAITWTQETLGWFPTWQLQLHSAAELLPTSPGSKKGSSDWFGTENIVLSDVEPKAGHLYEATTSLDAKNGALSFLLRDVTTEEILYRGGFHIPSIASQLYAVTGIIADKSAGANAASQVKIAHVEPGYLPLGATWEIGELTTDSTRFLPTTLFDTQAPSAAMQLTVPGFLPRGEFRISRVTAEAPQELARLVAEAENTVIPISIADLPLSKSILQMQYIEDGVIHFSDQKEIMVGRVSAHFFAPRVDWNERLIRSTLQLHSQGPITGLDITVHGTLYSTQWNAGKREFVDVPFATDININIEDVNLPPGESVAIPLNIALPETPGMWRLALSAHASPEIRFTVTNTEHVFSSYKPAPPSNEQPFSIVVLPDTQFMTRDFPQVYMRMMQWVAESAESKNTKLVLGVGDITQSNMPKEWEQARKGFDLLRGVVPYIISVGDHDMVQGSVTRGVSLVNNYFKPGEFESLAGLYKPGELDNAYYYIQLGGVDYLVLTLEFAPTNEALAWANQIVSQHPDRKVIVLTHAYVNGLAQPMGLNAFRDYSMSNDRTTTMNTGIEIWDKFIRKHANIAMVVAGHTGSIELPYFIARGDHGNKILQLLVNWQGEELGGNGWLAELSFSGQKLEARVYSPYLERFKTEVGRHGFTNHFVVDLDKMVVTDLPN